VIPPTLPSPIQPLADDSPNHNAINFSVNMKDGDYYLRLEIKGHLPENWGSYFNGIDFEHQSDGHTILYGALADQSIFLGVLAQINNLGLEIVNLTYLKQNTPTRKEEKPCSDLNCQSSNRPAPPNPPPISIRT
jgi:hypothetical protein